MTNQDILNELSMIECVLFYRADGSDDPENISTEDLWEADKKIRDLIEFWHSVTGLCITK